MSAWRGSEVKVALGTPPLELRASAPTSQAIWIAPLCCVGSIYGPCENSQGGWRLAKEPEDVRKALPKTQTGHLTYEPFNCILLAAPVIDLHRRRCARASFLPHQQTVLLSLPRPPAQPVLRPLRTPERSAPKRFPRRVACSTARTRARIGRRRDHGLSTF